MAAVGAGDGPWRHRQRISADHGELGNLDYHANPRNFRARISGERDQFVEQPRLDVLRHRMQSHWILFRDALKLVVKLDYKSELSALKGLQMQMFLCC
jgi:hypothetical protein